MYTCGNGINGDLGHSDIVHESLDHFRRVEHFQSSKISKGEGPIVKIFCRADNVLALTRNGHLYGWGGNACWEAKAAGTGKKPTAPAASGCAATCCIWTKRPDGGRTATSRSSRPG